MGVLGLGGAIFCPLVALVELVGEVSPLSPYLASGLILSGLKPL